MIKEDYSALLRQARQDNDYRYLADKYNISEKTQKHCGVGFVKDWQSPDKEDTTPSRPTCIIPRNQYNYVTIDTDFGARKEIGETEFFNLKKALQSPTPFIVRDELSAMAIIEAGGEAIALCDEKKIFELLKLLNDNYSGKERCFIFWLNDVEDKKKFQSNITRLINEEYQGINYVTARTITAKIDRQLSSLSIIETLQKDKTSLGILVETNKILARSRVEQVDIPKPINGASIAEWLRNTDRPPETRVKTGFKQLDKIMGGGFTPGLHVIGAAPGAGKTALALQMADQMADSGTEVVFFTLEMDAHELGSRSVSRHTYLENGLKTVKRQSGETKYLAKTAEEIYDSGYNSDYTDKEMNAIYKAISDYEQYCSRIYFFGRDLIYKKSDPVGTVIATIDKFAERHKKFAVILDYLQLIAHTSGTDNERLAVDNAVYSLKAISIQHQIPIFLISSVNRGSYSDPITMSSYKESGSIDFTASTLLGLQLWGADYSEGDKNQQERKLRIAELEKKAYTAQKDVSKNIQLELKIVKARKAVRGSIIFNAKLGFNYFAEAEDINAFVNSSHYDDNDEEDTVI